MSANKRYQGQFASMEFPAYVFQEYPKQVALANGASAIANSQKHELELMAEIGPPPPHPVEEERDKLLLEIQELKKKLTAHEDDA